MKNKLLITIIIILTILILVSVIIFSMISKDNYDEKQVKLQNLKYTDNIAVIFFENYPETEINFSNADKTKGNFKIEQDNIRLSLDIPFKGNDYYLTCTELGNPHTLKYELTKKKEIRKDINAENCFK
ncbi:MAG: hypothetical protein ABID45_01110 [Patescibacteria group bacterium]